MKTPIQKTLKALGGAISKEQVSSIEVFVAEQHRHLLLQMEENQNYVNADKTKAYLKLPYKYYGVPSPMITKILNDSFDNSRGFKHNFILGEELIRSDVWELKLCGINLWTKCHLGINQDAITVIKDVINEGYIEGWASCDTLAKTLRLAALHEGKSFDRILFDWKNEAYNTWIRRTALVSFVYRAKFGDNPPNYPGFSDELFKMCQECLKYKERFTQLGLGWLLRQMSLSDKARVIDFIMANYREFIRESLRYAIEKLPPEERDQILNYEPPVFQMPPTKKKRWQPKKNIK